MPDSIIYNTSVMRNKIELLKKYANVSELQDQEIYELLSQKIYDLCDEECSSYSNLCTSLFLSYDCLYIDPTLRDGCKLSDLIRSQLNFAADKEELKCIFDIASCRYLIHSPCCKTHDFIRNVLAAEDKSLID